MSRLGILIVSILMCLFSSAYGMELTNPIEKWAEWAEEKVKEREKTHSLRKKEQTKEDGEQPGGKKDKCNDAAAEQKERDGCV